MIETKSRDIEVWSAATHGPHVLCIGIVFYVELGVELGGVIEVIEEDIWVEQKDVGSHCMVFT